LPAFALAPGENDQRTGECSAWLSSMAGWDCVGMPITEHHRWFEVVETRGHVENGKVAHYQVNLKIGFTFEDDD
jgi:hypothetical protein